MKIALLTGGSDKPYVLGLASALTGRGLEVDLIGSDELDCEELRENPLVTFLNFRGDTSEQVGIREKLLRTGRYYSRLIRYARDSDCRLFHILWANRFPLLDRVLMNQWYRWCGRSLFLTVHNVNERARDGCDSAYNRLTLAYMYRAMDHLFVHTRQMKDALCDDFSIAKERVSQIPFGINNSLPLTSLTRGQARTRLGIAEHEHVVLAFGRIAPYKGLDLLVEATAGCRRRDKPIKLMIAGRTEAGCSAYLDEVRQQVAGLGLQDWVNEYIGFIPDKDVEIYFKATDLVVLPYRSIFQSGVLFLSYAFGVPVVASDIGAFPDDIEPGLTGYVFSNGDAVDLQRQLLRFFESDIFHRSEDSTKYIRRVANRRYSWGRVAEITVTQYQKTATAAGERSLRDRSARRSQRVS